MPHAFRDQRGFTLAELLVVTAVLGLILAGVMMIQQQGQQAYIMGSNRVETQQNARVALETMTRELRSAQAITALGGPTDVSFTDQNGAAIRYSLASGLLNRTSAGLTTPLIGGVQSLAMTYCQVWNGATNSCTTAAATPASTRVIVIDLVARTEEGAAASSFANQRATVRSVVRLRNQ
jgi:prepilin-type N-terminal cleavage/methylation domain-containing protein